MLPRLSRDVKEARAHYLPAAQPMLESVHGPPVFTVDSDADDADPASTRLVVVSNPLPFPNCVLVVSFDDRPDDEFETPVHGLIWATSGSSLFEPLFDLDEPAGSPSDEHEPHSSETLLTLPAFYLHVPFQHAWTQIHDFMYTRSPADLLDTLSIHIPTPTQHARTIPSGAATPSSDQGDLLDQLEGLRQIYLTAVCLQLPDDVLWDILHAEWSRLYKLYHDPPRD